MLHFRVVSTNISLVMKMMKKADGTLHADQGIDFFLLQVLSQTIPFSYTLKEREDGIYGSVDSRGRWTGMIGMVERNEADIAIGWIGITYPRQKIVDFCFPYLVDKNVIITAASKPFPNEVAFLYPFHYLVWIFILISIPLSALIVTCLQSFKTSNNTGLKSFSRVFLARLENVTALLLNKGNFKNYVDNATRLYISTWSFASIVLGLSYSCTLLSFYLAPLKEASLESVQELRDAVIKGQYKFGVLNGSSHYVNLMAAEQGYMKDLADHVRSHPENVMHRFDEVSHRIKTEKYAYQSFRLFSVLSTNAYGRHHFHIFPDGIGFNPVSIAFKKHFPYMEAVNRVIHRITESGIYYKKVKDLMFWAKLKGPPPLPTEVGRPLSLADVEGLLLLLALGLILSTCCLFTEILYKKCNKVRML